MAESSEPNDLSMASFIKRNPKYEQAFEQRGQVQEFLWCQTVCHIFIFYCIVVWTQVFQAYLVWPMAFGQMSSTFCFRPKCPDRIFLTAISCLEFFSPTAQFTCSRDPRSLLLRFNLWTWYAVILMRMEWLPNWSNARRKDIPYVLQFPCNDMQCTVWFCWLFERTLISAIHMWYQEAHGL